MSEGWEPGDVAVCVDDRNYGPEGGLLPGIKLGAEYIVRRAFMWRGSGYSPIGEDEPQAIIGLYGAINDLSHNGMYAAARFVKRRSLLEEDERETAREIEKETTA